MASKTATTTAATTPTRAAARAATREVILAAADEVFGAIGYDAASTREIAESCGVNKALIHYHFKNKEGLLASVLDRYYGRLGAQIADALGGAGPLRRKLLRLVDAYADFLGQNLRFCRIVQREASGGMHADKIRDRMVPIFELGRAAIVAEYPTSATGELAAEQLLISAYGMIVTWFTYGDVQAPLLGSSPTPKRQLAARKRHVRRIANLLMDELERTEKAAAGSGEGGS